MAQSSRKFQSQCIQMVTEILFYFIYLFIYFSYFLQSTCPKACGFSCKDRLRSNMDNIHGRKKEV